MNKNAVMIITRPAAFATSMTATAGDKPPSTRSEQIVFRFEMNMVGPLPYVTGMLPHTMVPAMSGYAQREGNHYDLETTRRLIAEACYPEGRDFPDITILYPTGSGTAEIYEYIQQQCSENLGISVRIENAEWKTILKRGYSQDFDLMFMKWIGDYLEPKTFLELFQTDTGT